MLGFDDPIVRIFVSGLLHQNRRMPCPEAIRPWLRALAVHARDLARTREERCGAQERAVGSLLPANPKFPLISF